jgi:hypothetical protein
MTQAKGRNESRETRSERRKRRFAFLSLFSLFAFAAAGCKNPFDRTRNADGGGALGIFGTGANMVVFSSELATGGGAFLYPSGENQALSFNDTSNPVSARSIRYTWNGQEVPNSGVQQHIFAGFDLMHVPTQAAYTSTPGRDLRQANYSRVSFYARGTLSTNTFAKIEVADDGNTGTPAPCANLSESGLLDDTNIGATPCNNPKVLSSQWRAYEIPISNNNLQGLKDFFKVTFIYNQPVGNAPGQGGTIYIDNIVYLP